MQRVQDFAISVELAFRDGDVRLRLVDHDLGKGRGCIVCEGNLDVRVKGQWHVSFDRKSDLFFAGDQHGVVFLRPVEVIPVVDNKAAKA